MILHRLRKDFDLATITVIGAVALVGITPFAVYRYFSGNTVAALMDVSIVICIILAIADAWLSGNVKRATVILCTVTNLGCIAGATVLGLPGLFWTFPVLALNSLLLSYRMSAAASIFTLGFLALHGKAFSSALELSMYLSSALTVVLVAVSFAYRTESQRKMLESLALLDPLTGAQNRRGMDQELDIAIKSFGRDGKPYGLAIFDLDLFKRINDKYGHEVGDDVLISFANIVRSNSRKMDRFFRMGGEEFVLLFPGTDMDTLRTICESHRNIIEKTLRCHGETITTSIGAAILIAGEGQQEWLARADAALYAAKTAGRNRFVIDDGHAAPISKLAQANGTT